MTSLYIYLSIGFFLLVAFILLNYKFKWYTKENYETVCEGDPMSLMGLILAILFIWPVVIFACIFLLIIKYFPKILPKE